MAKAASAIVLALLRRRYISHAHQKSEWRCGVETRAERRWRLISRVWRVMKMAKMAKRGVMKIEKQRKLKAKNMKLAKDKIMAPKRKQYETERSEEITSR
jgi:hypothetical protein